jgi:predicted amidohydrolase
MARNVKIGVAAVTMDIVTVEQRRKDLLSLTEQAGRAGCDIFCLPEYSPCQRTKEAIASWEAHEKKWIQKFAEPIPGPLTNDLCRIASKYKMNLIAPMIEKNKDGKCYNTAAIFGRKGKLIGTYRKTHLPEGEETDGLTPGNSLPVFDMDFGKIAVYTCYDINFPEITRVYELSGAEIVFWATVMTMGPHDFEGDLIPRLRAMDHGLTVACSTFVYSAPPQGQNAMVSCVIGNTGRVLASSDGRAGVVSADVDLDARREVPLKWNEPEMVDRIEFLRSRRRPELYDRIVQKQPKYNVSPPKRNLKAK